MSTKVTADKEVWPTLIEKALVIHFGGWKAVEGGCPVDAFQAMTGCTDTEGWTVEKDRQRVAFGGNSVGGSMACGGKTISYDEFMDKLCEYDKNNYVMCAGTNQGSGNHDNNQQGIADSHAYSVIAAKKNVAGKVDMICFRNPWGKQEFEGAWHDGGPKFKENPDVLAELGHKEDPTDGLFWMSKEDAFKFFHCFYVCKKAMNGSKMQVSKVKAKNEETVKGRKAEPTKA
eukprot:3429420-Rhodomonas_salina.1